MPGKGPVWRCIMQESSNPSQRRWQTLIRPSCYFRQNCDLSERQCSIIRCPSPPFNASLQSYLCLWCKIKGNCSNTCLAEVLFCCWMVRTDADFLCNWPNFCARILDVAVHSVIVMRSTCLSSRPVMWWGWRGLTRFNPSLPYMHTPIPY